MLRIGPGVQKTDRDRFDFFFFDEPPDRVHHISVVERNDLLTEVIYSLAHTDDSLSRHQRLWFGYPGDMANFFLRETIDSANGAHDLRRVFESSCGDEADFHSTARDQRVGRHRAAVFEKRGSAEKFISLHADTARRFIDRVHDTAGKIVGRGGGLRRPHFSVVTQDDDVGKCSAGIYADNVLFLRCHEVPSRKRSAN